MNKPTGQTDATLFSLPSDLEVVSQRVLDAPRELVFKIYTDPQHIPHWWGPRYLTTTVEQMDVQPGGAWRFVQRDPQGNVYAFYGVYREVTPPEKLVSTFGFEAMAGHELVETALFEDLGGKTRLTVTSRYQSKEDRDGMVNSGMESGVNESWDRFAELLAVVARVNPG
jgi:uncharacterized protein YndB with AHSA1/START domain